MGIPRFWIISWPTAKKVSAESWLMVRLSENQVPQNTPITRAKSTIVVAWAARTFTDSSYPRVKGSLGTATSLGRFRSQAAGQPGQQVRPVIVVRSHGAEPDQEGGGGA